MPGDVLDLILIAVIAAFAVAGYRQGFIIGVLSLVGFLGGVAVGAYLAPGLARALAKSATWQAFLAIVVVFAFSVIGMMIASGIGVALRSRVIAKPATVIDSIGGATVNVLAVVIVAWLIGSFVGNSAAFPAIARQVHNSAVLRTVDRVMPSSVQYLPFFPQLKVMLSNGVYSQVFGDLAASGIGVPGPDTSLVPAAARTSATASVVKINGTASSCSQAIEGSGFVISPQHVLTNAHVVAGVGAGSLVVTMSSGVQYANVKVVLYDPNTDLAVLYVPALTARPLTFASQTASGQPAAVAGYPENEPLNVIAAGVGESFTATGPNIYQDETVHRQMYEIRSDIQPGNSGGPLLSASGQVYGVVFAKSTYLQDIGYALTAAEVDSDVDAGENDFTPVSTMSCQAG